MDTGSGNKYNSIMPILVYLDSSDISNLAHRTDDPLYAELNNLLIRGSEAGLIKVPFSHVHLSELLPHDESHLNQSLERASKLREISSGNCFVDVVSLQRVELAQALKGEVNKELVLSNVLRDDGKWLLGFDVKNAGVGRSVHLPETISGPRNKRRQYARERAGFIKTMASTYQRTYAFSDPIKARDLATRLVNGDLSYEEFHRMAEENVYDIVRFVEHHAAENTPYASLRASLEGLESAFATVYEELTRIAFRVSSAAQQVRGRIGDDPIIDETIAITQSGVAQQLAGIRRSYAQRLNQEPRSAAGLEDEVIAQCKSITIPFDFIQARITTLFDDTTEGRVPHPKPPKQYKSSDAGDAQHLTYLPLVDCFRCDKRTALVLERLGIAQDGRIFPTAKQLSEYLGQLVENNESVS